MASVTSAVLLCMTHEQTTVDHVENSVCYIFVFDFVCAYFVKELCFGHAVRAASDGLP